MTKEGKYFRMSDEALIAFEKFKNENNIAKDTDTINRIIEIACLKYPREKIEYDRQIQQYQLIKDKYDKLRKLSKQMNDIKNQINELI